MTKRLAMMQPYFFPYLGYFSLIKHSDFFILSDNVQYIRQGWIERNRILKQDNGWMYIKVPLLSHKYDDIIKDIRVNNNISWRETILKNLLHYKKKSPFYNETINVIKKSIEIETDSIVELNKSALINVCNYLSISLELGVFTEMNIPLKKKITAPDEWSLYTCKALGYDTYINPPGGVEIYDTKKYHENNVNIKFLRTKLNFYSQRRGPENFEPGLSIIDVMMFNSPEKIREMLDDYEFIK